MTDPATNALALQMEYGDEELKKDIEKLIRVIVRDELVKLLNDSEQGERFITNNAWVLERIIKQAVKNMAAQITVY